MTKKKVKMTEIVLPPAQRMVLFNFAAARVEQFHDVVFQGEAVYALPEQLAPVLEAADLLGIETGSAARLDTDKEVKCDGVRLQLSALDRILLYDYVTMHGDTAFAGVSFRGLDIMVPLDCLTTFQGTVDFLGILSATPANRAWTEAVKAKEFKESAEVPSWGPYVA